jgi:hypothetical protein
MESVRDYVEMEYQKDLISQLLKQVFVDASEKDYEELTEMVFNKIHLQNSIRQNFKITKEDSLARTAEYYGVTTNAVLDAFLFFNLVVENVFLTKKLSEYVKEEN